MEKHNQQVQNDNESNNENNFLQMIQMRVMRIVPFECIGFKISRRYDTFTLIYDVEENTFPI